MKINLIIIIILISLTGIIMAADFTPQGNINLRGDYGILNVTNISFLDGTQMLTAYNSSWNQTKADALYFSLFGGVVSGNVTANYFFGDGSGLTGIDGSGDFSFTDYQASFNSNFTAKDTDDLSEGSNKYDNQTWNQILADSKYALIGAGGNASWNQSFANTLYAEIIWGYNQTLGVNQVYVEGLGFVTGAHTVDTNESTRFGNLVDDNCAGNDKMIGVYPNGTVQCSAVAGGGDFSFTDFQGSFDSNWSDLNYDRWMYNQTLGVDTSYVEGLGFVQGVHTIIWNTLFNSTLTDFVNTWLGTKTTDDLAEGSTNKYEDGNTFNSTYDDKVTDNQTWSESLANTLYADISVVGTVTSVAAGNGMSFSTITGSGSVTLGTPSTLTGSTSNGLTSTSHTHAVTTDSSGLCGAGTICGGGHDHDGDYLISLAGDSSPQLGGYLDTAGENIGSTSDEIENIYMAQNNRAYYGNAQEASIYFNGTDLVIEVS